MIIRNDLKQSFSQVPNLLIEDLDLSAQAKCIAFYLFSRPDKWVVRRDDVKKVIGVKDNHTYAKKLKELIDKGWLTKIISRCEDGKFSHYEFHLSNYPKKDHMGKKPTWEKNPHGEKPHVGKNPTLSNTDITINTNKDNNNKVRYLKDLKKEDLKGFKENEIPFLKMALAFRELFLRSYMDSGADKKRLAKLDSFKIKESTNVFRKLEKQGISIDDLRNVFNFLKQDDFWSKQVRSFTKLYLQCSLTGPKKGQLIMLASDLKANKKEQNTILPKISARC